MDIQDAGSAKRDLALFALEASRPFGTRVAEALGIALEAHEERSFEDGEHKARPLVSVRGRDVYVVHSLYGEAGETANDKLIRLLFFVGGLRDASARRITAMIPYLAYARKDRKTKSRDPVSTRYVAQLFEAMGVDRVVTLDVHNLAAYQNAFRCCTEHLEASPLLVRHLAPSLRDAPVIVVSPDAGAIKRADAFRRRLGIALGGPIALGFAEKYRSGGTVSGEAFLGDVDGKIAVIVDDLISSGTTMARTAIACRARGAVRVVGVATHGLFTVGADRVLSEAFDKLVVTDSVASTRVSTAALGAKLERVSVAGLFAEAIRRLHDDGSLVELGE